MVKKIPGPSSLIFLVCCLRDILNSRLCQLYKKNFVKSHTFFMSWKSSCKTSINSSLLMWKKIKEQQKQQQQKIGVNFHWNLWEILHAQLYQYYLFRILTYCNNQLIKYLSNDLSILSESSSLLKYICLTVLLQYFYFHFGTY